MQAALNTDTNKTDSSPKLINLYNNNYLKINDLLTKI